MSANLQRVRLGEAPWWLRSWHGVRRALWWCPPARRLIPDPHRQLVQRGLVSDWPWD